MKILEKGCLIKACILSFVFIAVSGAISFFDIREYIEEKKKLESASHEVKWSNTDRENSEVIRVVRYCLENRYISDSDSKFLLKADPQNLAIDFLNLDSPLDFSQFTGDVNIEDILTEDEGNVELYKVYKEDKVKKVLATFSLMSKRKKLESFHEEYFFEATKDLDFSTQLQEYKIGLFSDRVEGISFVYYNLYLLYPNVSDVEALRARVNNLIGISETIIKSVKTIDRVFTAYAHCNQALRVLVNLHPATQEALKKEIDYFKAIMSTMKPFFASNHELERTHWNNISFVARIGMDKSVFIQDEVFKEQLKASRSMEYFFIDRQVNYLPMLIILVALLWLSAVLFRKTESVSFISPNKKTLLLCFLMPVVLLGLYSLLCNFLPHREKTISYSMYGYCYEKIFIFMSFILVPVYFLVIDLKGQKKIISNSSKVFMAVCLSLPLFATFFDLNSLNKPMSDIVAFGCFIGPGVALIIFLLINYVKSIVIKEKSVFIKASYPHILLLAAYLIFILSLNGLILRSFEKYYARQDTFSKIVKDENKARLYLVDKGVDIFREYLRNANPKDYILNEKMKKKIALKIMSAENIRLEVEGRKALEEAVIKRIERRYKRNR